MAPTNRQLFVAGQLIARRLDALGKLQSGCGGLSSWFVKVFFVAGGVWAMAAAQTLSFVYLMGVFLLELPMSSTQGTLLATGGLMTGAFVGAFLFGSLAEVHGRKIALLSAFTLAHAAGTLCAVGQSVPVLTAIRFVVGLGLGGQQPVLCALIMELAPSNVRGRTLVYLDAFTAIGSTLAMVFCHEIEPSIGWQGVCACNALALLYLPVLYYCVPESPKWLATVGRIDDALSVLRQIEHASSVFNGEEADFAIKNAVEAKLNGGPSTGFLNAATVATASTVPANYMTIEVRRPSFFKLVRDRVRLLLRFPYLARTLTLWFMWTVLAATNSAMCVYLDDSFIDEVSDKTEKRLLSYGVLVAQLLGNLAACSLIDRVGRRPTIISFVLVASAGSLLEVYLTRTIPLMLFSSCLRNFAFYGAWGCMFAYTIELYPNAIRVIGIGYAWGVSRLGYFAGPQAVFWLKDNLGATKVDVTWVLAAFALVAAASIFAFGIETRNHDAEKARYRTSSMTTDRTSTGESPTSAPSYQKHVDDDDELMAIGKNRPLHFI
ncbi:Metal ion transporter [Globisporangium polare]